MMKTRELSLTRVLLVYAAGVAAGVQGALYLFDTFDDGVADGKSGAIGLVFLALGLAFIFRSFRKPGGAR
jgi:hypothetical protein